MSGMFGLLRIRKGRVSGDREIKLRDNEVKCNEYKI